MWRSVNRCVSLLFTRGYTAMPGRLHTRLCHAFSFIVRFIRFKTYSFTDGVAYVTKSEGSEAGKLTSLLRGGGA